MIKNKNIIKYLIIFTILFIALYFSFIITSFSLSWLRFNDAKQGQSVIGGIILEVYLNNVDITYSTDQTIPVTLGAKNVATNLNLKIRNSGNINALLRVTISLSTTKQVVGGTGQTYNSNDLSLNTPGWVDNFMVVGAAKMFSGDMFYNSILTPYKKASQEISIVTSITPKTDSVATKTLFMYLSFEAIPHAGNPYKLNETIKPWKNIPSSWTAFN